MTDIKQKKSGLFTLNSKMFYTLIIALAVASLLSYLVESVSVWVIDEYLLTEKAVESRQESLLSDFAEYVDENAVASDDTELLDEWCKKNNNAYITIYREDKAVLREPPADFRSDGSTVNDDESNDSNITDSSQLPDGNDFDSAALPSVDERTASESDNSQSFEAALPDYKRGEGGRGNRGETVYSNNAYYYYVHLVRFSDGVCSVTITDTTESYYYDVAAFTGWTAFFLAFFLVMLLYNRYVIKRVNSVSQQVKTVKNGNLNNSVVLQGKDELSALASDVDDMRNSILERYTGEQNAWKANQELITSISHDIRNPLTTLIGYSDMLVNKQYESPEQMETFLGVCREKAYRLKDMTDEMFRYFLVFAEPEIKTDNKSENAQILLEQLLGEGLADLRFRGFDINFVPAEGDSEIFVDALMLKRVFDNLFSNLIKYADKDTPVRVTTTESNDFIAVSISNKIRRNSNAVESTKIGIKTCQRLCCAQEIDFSFTEESGVYTSVLKIPVLKQNEVITE